MAFTGHSAWYTSSNAYANVTAWATGVAISVGDVRKQSGTPTAGNERCYVCVGPIGGFTTGASDPLTVFTRGNIITDNTTGKWQECTGIPALNGDKTNTPNWTNGAKSTTITLGHVIQSGDGTKILICTVGGAAGSGAEPTWSNTLGGTTVDSAATWTTIKISSNNFANWAAPHAKIRNASASTWGGTVGTKHFVGSSHNASEAPASNTTDNVLSSLGSLTAPLEYLCVNEAGSVPPVSADLTTGGKETTTGTTSRIDLRCFGYVYGLTWECQATSGSVEIVFGTTNNGDVIFENCIFNYSGSNTSGSFGISSSGRVTFINCTFRFGASAQTIGITEWAQFINCTFADTGTVPSVLFNVTPLSTGGGHTLHVIGGDASTITGTIYKFLVASVATVVIEGLKISSSLSKMFDSSAIATRMKQIGVASKCSSDTKTNRVWLSSLSGDVIAEATAVRTTGAAEGGVGHALKVATNANASSTIMGGDHLQAPWCSRYNTTTGSNVTVTICGLIFAAALPTNFDVNMDVQYFGSSSTPQYSRKTSRPDQLSTPASLTSDSSSWDSVAAARQNSHAYNVGDFIKTASTAGSIFQCTTGGTSAGSEPGGYTAAADGSSITDGTAVFRTNNRFKISVTLTSPTPQLVGPIKARLMFFKPSTTWYFDPYLTLT